MSNWTNISAHNLTASLSAIAATATLGNVGVLTVRVFTSAGLQLVTSVTDANSGVWTEIVGARVLDSSGKQALQTFVCLSLPVTGSNTITTHGSGQFFEMGYSEYHYAGAGTLAIDTAAANGASAGSAGTAYSSPAYTKTSGWTDELLIGNTCNSTADSLTVTVSAPFSLVITGSGNQTTAFMESTTDPNTFSGTYSSSVVWSASVAGIGIAPASSPAFSYTDCRVAKPNSATSRTVNGTKIDDVQTSSNSAIPPTDSRVSKPVASGTYPQNSRAPGTNGPGN